MNQMSVMVASLGALVAVAAVAQSEQRPPPHSPTKEAYKACSTKSQGDTCSVQFHGGEVAGVCAPGPQSSSLFCRPDRPPPGDHQPPPEALAACSRKADSDSCTATLPDASARSGTCKADPDSRIGCMPARN